MLPQMRRKSRAEKRRLVAQIGGQAVVKKYGREHMGAISKGRLPFMEQVKRDWAKMGVTMRKEE